MAKDVLAVPISGVGVERVFSIARQICTYQRHRLNPETLKMLVIVRQQRRHRASADGVDDSDGAKEDTEGKYTFADADYTLAEEQLISDEENDSDDEGDDE
jgi:hypothetical protein